jgi:hypothetical protein
VYLLRIAESLRRQRVDNRAGVLALQRLLVAGLCAPKPPAAPAPTPQPPTVEPYPDIFFIEGEALGGSHGPRPSSSS